MGRHNGATHARAEAHRLRHQPSPPRVEGDPLRADDRVTVAGSPVAGRVLWYDWRDLEGNYVDPTGRTGRDKRNGSWWALFLPDGGVSRAVPVRQLARERITR